MTKNKIARYMVLDELLSNQLHPRTLDELTDKVNEELARYEMATVTRRCVEKDIQFLEYDSPWMVEIERKSVADENPETGRVVTRRCLCYREPGYSIFKKQLTEDEKYLLSETLSLLGQFDGLPEFDGLENLIKSLDIKQPKQIIQIEKNPLQNSTLFSQAYNAVSKQWTIDLHYHTYQEPNRDRCIKFFPYLVKEYNHRWYLIGAAASDRKLLSFALDRINDIVPTPGIPFYPYKGDLNERYEDIIGITYYENEPLCEILFWVSNQSKDYVKTKPLHDSQRHYKNDEKYRNEYPSLIGGAFFTITCRQNYELIRELSQYGADLIVLSPQDIQDKVFNRILSMIEIYSKLRT